LIFDSIASFISKGGNFFIEDAIPPAQGLKSWFFSFSIIKTEYPFFAKFRAVEDPDKPPPIITTSKHFKLLEFPSLFQTIWFLLEQ